MNLDRRILIATPLYPPDAGGPATYSRILEVELPKKSLEVTVVTFGSVRHLPKVIRHIAYFLKVLREAKNADTIFALDPVSVGLPALLASWVMRKTCIVKVVGDYAWEQGRQRFGITESLDTFVLEKCIPVPVQLLRLIQKTVCLRASRVLVPSEYLKRIVTEWGVPPEKIHVVYNAVSISEIAVLQNEITASDTFRIVTVGRLVPWKHVDGVIDAVKQIESRGIHTSLVVIGDGPLFDTLAAHAQKSGITNCMFLGQKEHAVVLAEMRAADVFVLNSSYEGLSHVLIEALMLGKSIVATDAGGNSELITDEVSGLLIPVGDTGALADALKRISEDVSLQNKLQAGALEASASFTVPHMIEKTVAALS